MEVRETEVARWRVEGSGPPLVLVHGLSGSWRWWQAVLEPLAQRYETHLLDVPRFRGAFGGPGVADWLAGWMDSAGIARARVAGHSLGGAAAALLAAARPERVEALALVSPAGMPSGRRLAGYALPLVAALRTAGPAFLRTLTGDALRTGPESLLRGILYAAGVDVREQARAIRTPTLLLWGEHDTLVPVSEADLWLECVPHARLVTVAGAGHVPMVERPAETAAALLEFLDQPGDVARARPVDGVTRVRDDDELAGR